MAEHFRFLGITMEYMTVIFTISTFVFESATFSLEEHLSERLHLKSGNEDRGHCRSTRKEHHFCPSIKGGKFRQIFGLDSPNYGPDIGQL